MRRITRMPRSLDMTRNRDTAVEVADVLPGGTRAQAINRLQIGVGGVVLMVLLVGLASLIENRTREVDAAAVPAAAPTTEPSEAPKRNDPLVEAGVVPDLPAQPATQAGQPPSAAQGQGRGDEAPNGQ